MHPNPTARHASPVPERAVPDSQSRAILAGILRGSLANEPSLWKVQRLHVDSQRKRQ